MLIHPLSEGIFTIGFDKVFVPFDPELDVLEHRPSGSLLVEIQPFLVLVDKEVILLDTGLGYKGTDGNLQIHNNLLVHGIEPKQVSKVILSHLHKDHAGGISYTDELGISHLSFPTATYYVSKQEFDYGMEKGFPSYTTEDFELLRNSSHVEWLEEHGMISNFIEYETVGGHCPYHITLKIHHGNDTVFFGGDVAPQMKQLKTKYMAKYDHDSRRSMELRQQFAEQGMAENWTFLFYHDVKEPMGRL